MTSNTVWRCPFGQSLLNARDILGLTQTELAELIGVSFSTVNRWENGKTRPRGLIEKRAWEVMYNADCILTEQHRRLGLPKRGPKKRAACQEVAQKKRKEHSRTVNRKKGVDEFTASENLPGPIEQQPPETPPQPTRREPPPLREIPDAELLSLLERHVFLKNSEQESEAWRRAALLKQKYPHQVLAFFKRAAEDNFEQNRHIMIYAEKARIFLKIRHVYAEILDEREEWEAYAKAFKKKYEGRHKMQREFGKIVPDWDRL